MEMNNREIPLIKEYRVHQILKKCLDCFEQYTYDREKQRQCILKLYKTDDKKDLKHWDKSIFRGMVIPSLRYLELIYGEGDALKVSANGKVIIESEKINIDLHYRVLRAIILEIDKKKFRFIDMIGKKKYIKNDFIDLMNKNLKGSSDRQKRERINKWFLILKEVNLVKYEDEITINVNNYRLSLQDTNANLKDSSTFLKILLVSYKKLVKDKAGIINIENLRKEVGLEFLKNKHEILTELQFDELFRKIPFETENYLFSLGKPMGAIEKLFQHRGNYYRTLHIKFITN